MKIKVIKKNGLVSRKISYKLKNQHSYLKHTGKNRYKNTYSPSDTPHSNDLSQVAIIMKDFRYTNNSKTKNHGLHMYIYILPYSEVIPDIKDGKE